MPWFGEDEQRWPKVPRAIAYFLLIMWCFLGVALVAEVFMGAIEAITSRKRRRWVDATKSYVTLVVWNPTVANLTLMALGSSAPEILLSVIELLKRDFYSGSLGPSTIVGSAAFNLFVIIAVCIMAIPDNELRAIKELPVYCVTAASSLLAYIWLLVILIGVSSDVVEIWEAVITIVFLPVLVFLAFVADKGYFSAREAQTESAEPNSPVMRLSVGMSQEEIAQAEAQIRQKYGNGLSEGQVARIIAAQSTDGQSRAARRVAATRTLTGSKRVERPLHSATSSGFLLGSVGSQSSTLSGSHGQAKTSKVAPEPPEEDAMGSSLVRAFTAETEEKCVIAFASLSFAAIEGSDSVQAKVLRTGCLSRQARVGYSTREFTALGGVDFIHNVGTLTFALGVTEQTVNVKLITSDEESGNEVFYVDLSEPSMAVGDEDDLEVTVELGLATASMAIIQNGDAGEISFPQDQISVRESPSGDLVVSLMVQRTQGFTGLVSCRYFSEDDTAVAGVDYEKLDGTLTLMHGESAALIECTIKCRGRYDSTDIFRVVLADIEGDARFDPKTDGGEDSCILTVVIESQGQEGKDRVDRILRRLKRKWEKSRIGYANWKDQFLNALYVNGKPDDPEDKGRESIRDSFASDGVVPSPSITQSNDSTTASAPSCADYAMHVISLPWKLLFAFVPPTDYCNGWLCFHCSLLMIALVTAVIGDCAEMFGCVLEMPNEVTAITLVALGTSLPDTFASWSAAVDDPTADASVGNVTGSNSVNVFLGLGLPWTMGSIYWAIKGPDAEWLRRFQNDVDLPTGAFVVKAGTLGFSVALFSCLALSAITMLYVRRRLVGGELGGPRVNKMLSSLFLIALWVIYVSVSSWYALREARACG